MKYFVFVLFLIITPELHAQKEKKIEWDDWTQSPFRSTMYNFAETTPFMSLSGGISVFSADVLKTPIENDITGSVFIGMEQYNTSSKSNMIAHREASGINLGYHFAPTMDPVQGIESDPPTTSTFSYNIFRFGITDEVSYGYKFQESRNSGVYLSSGQSVLSWSVPGAGSIIQDSIQNRSIQRFDGLRFGETMNAAIDILVDEPVSLEVRYDWTQIYPRHMFWYWTLSQLIEGIAANGMKFFVNTIGQSSPLALPIMNFILQNGVALGFKALRMNKMNWPFTTEAPLNVMSFSVGATIHF